MDVTVDLITACIRGERRAHNELYKVTYSYLLSVCLRYTGSKDKASEILNLSFLKIINNLDRYKPEIPFKTWARRITINTLIDEFRKEKIIQNNIDFVEEYKEARSGATINEKLEEFNVEQILALIRQLPPVSQRVFNLFSIDGYSHKEISDMMKISEGTSKWHVNFAREKLKEMIEEINKNVKIALS